MFSFVHRFLNLLRCFLSVLGHLLVLLFEVITFGAFAHACLKAPRAQIANALIFKKKGAKGLLRGKLVQDEQQSNTRSVARNCQPCEYLVTLNRIHRLQRFKSTAAWIVWCFLSVYSISVAAQSHAFIRINQVGYLASDEKVAIAFSKTPLQGDFVLLDASNRVVYRAPLKSVLAPNWGGAFPHYYELNFSAYKQPGRNVLRIENGGIVSKQFTIGSYPNYEDELPLALRQIL